MNWKLILVVGAILIPGTIIAQSSDSQRTKNQTLNESGGSEDWMMGHGYYLDSKKEEVRRDRTAAESGDATAQFKMALRYDSGKGVEQDYAEAVNWLHKAAGQGLVKAQFNLAMMYANGLGVPQDHAEAAKWYRTAADQGFTSAQKNLGVQYGLGQGVPKSHADAFVWSSIAAMSGDDGAIANRDFAASRLSPEDLQAAQERASKIHLEIQHSKE